jgi:hypothetical protein
MGWPFVVVAREKTGRGKYYAPRPAPCNKDRSEPHSQRVCFGRDQPTASASRSKSLRGLKPSGKPALKVWQDRGNHRQAHGLGGFIFLFKRNIWAESEHMFRKQKGPCGPPCRYPGKGLCGFVDAVQ